MGLYRQQVADRGVPDRGFISSLLGTGHPDNNMADPALTTNRRRKRKKKRRLSM
jgi:hypothetical protein